MLTVIKAIKNTVCKHEDDHWLAGEVHAPINKCVWYCRECHKLFWRWDFSLPKDFHPDQVVLFSGEIVDVERFRDKKFVKQAIQEIENWMHEKENNNGR